MVSYSSLCIYWKWPQPYQKFQFASVLAASFFFHLSLGIIYTFGNLSPYFVSYIRLRSHPSELHFTDAGFIFACQIAGQGSIVAMGGVLERKLGPRVTTLLGGWIMTFGVFLTYFAVQVSFYFMLVTYGIMFGVGVGLAYVGPIACAMRWVPKWKGLASGIVVAGFGLSAFFFDAIQTAFINPLNEQPNSAPINSNPNEKYFSQSQLLDHVPYVFLLQGGMLGLMQLGSAIFLVNPAPDDDTVVYHPNTESIDVVQTKSDDGEEMSLSLDDDVSPLKVFTKFHFYILWLMMFNLGTIISFMTSLYKTFGLSEISEDDHFLSITGSISALFNFLGRILWGLLADLTDCKFALVLQSSMLACFILTLYATLKGGSVMFTIWICMIFFCIGGVFSLFPTAVCELFGSKYVSINYGLVYTAMSVGSIFAAFISHLLVKEIQWYGVFLLLGVMNIVELILALIFHIQAKRTIK
jgi:MFS family permease